MGIKGEDTVKPSEIPPKNVIKANGSVAPKTEAVNDDRKQTLIVRQNSVSNACMLLQNQKQVDADLVISMASMFESWVLREENDDVPF